jgi:hypothetical protein
VRAANATTSTCSPSVTGLNLQSVAPSGVVRQIVIDASARMGLADRLEDVKAAALQLVDRADPGDTIGVISFDGAATVRQPLTVVADEASRATIKAAIETIVPGTADAATGAALQQALNDLAGLPQETTRAVYLIAGGRHTTGAAPFDLVGAYQAAFVKLYTLGYITIQALPPSSRSWLHRPAASSPSSTATPAIRPAWSMCSMP